MGPIYLFRCRASNPNKCLLDPKSSNTIFFEGCENPTKPNLKIHTHLFYTNHPEKSKGASPLEKLNIVSE